MYKIRDGIDGDQHQIKKQKNYCVKHSNPNA